MHRANDTLGQIRLTQSEHSVRQCWGQSRDISVTEHSREQAATTLDSEAEAEVEKESVKISQCRERMRESKDVAGVAEGMEPAMKICSSVCDWRC